MDFQQAKFTLHHLQRGLDIGRLQSDIGAAENFIAGCHFNVQLGHASDRHISLASGGYVGGRLRLHAVDKGIGSKLKGHLAHRNSKRGYEFGMVVGLHRPAEIV